MNAVSKQGKISIESHSGVDFWYASWYDDGCRRIKRRLAVLEGTSEEEAQILAANAFESHAANLRRSLEERAKKSRDELVEIAQYTSFPRAVVAKQIRRLCQNIAREDLGYTTGSEGDRPGLHLFAERADLSAREVHRILDDQERFTVSLTTVDKICCAFDGLLLDDFIASSFEWAERTGEWSDRDGANDPYPIGPLYAAPSPKSEEWF